MMDSAVGARRAEKGLRMHRDNVRGVVGGLVVTAAILGVIGSIAPASHRMMPAAAPALASAPAGPYRLSGAGEAVAPAAMLWRTPARRPRLPSDSREMQ
jgi:hypothetical protein